MKKILILLITFFPSISVNALTGDVNTDGQVNVLDVVQLINQISGGQNSFASDCNQDNATNILDVICVINLISNRGSFSGIVRDAATNLPLPGVKIRLFQNGTDEVNGNFITDTNGNYNIEALLSDTRYDLVFSINDFITARYTNAVTRFDEFVFLNELLLISNTDLGIGTFSGVITDTLFGNGVANLNINIRLGINITTGVLVATTFTDNNGGYTVSSLTAGYYTCEITGNGFNTLYTTVIVVGGAIKNNQNTVISSSSNTNPTTTDGIEFVFVPGGTYMMGSDSGSSIEKPVHQVTVNDLWVSKYEITQKQWKDIMGTNPSHFSSCGDNCPVEIVSWNDLQEYITKLNQLPNQQFTYRLPTEAEWEYAARSGGKNETYAGGENLNAVAWYTSNSGSKTHQVGTKSANGLGLYDMSGNVWEWVQDWYSSSYYGSSPTNNPQGPNTGSFRVLRGCSWNRSAVNCRTASRVRDAPDGRFINAGARLVRLP